MVLLWSVSNLCRMLHFVDLVDVSNKELLQSSFNCVETKESFIESFIVTLYL